MRALRSGCLAVLLGGLAALGAASSPAQAQFGYGGGGGGGYGGGGYDRPPQPDYDRRRDDRRRDYDQPGYGERGGRGGGGGGSQASGSFVQSCQNIQQNGSYLTASCRVRGGGFRESSIDTRQCRRIGNSNGRLICE